nr:WYL domain-containing protein [Angustibacter aerolatus]
MTAIRQVTTANAGDAAVPPPDPHVTAALVQASDAGRRVRVTYLLPEPREMDVDPWAVSVRRGRWYLLCWSHTRDAQRVLRVDRVRDVRVLDERFERPAGLDPVAAVEAHLSTGWRYEVEVLVDAPLADVERWVPRNLGRLEAVSPRRTRLTGTTDEPRWYAWHLVGLDAPYRIVSPPEPARGGPHPRAPPHPRRHRAAHRPPRPDALTRVSPTTPRSRRRTPAGTARRPAPTAPGRRAAPRRSPAPSPRRAPAATSRRRR